MASAAPAYRYDSARQSAPRPQRRTTVHVVPGRRPAESVSPQLVTAAKAFMVVLAIVALVACVRIGLAAATVTTMIQSESISSQVENLRSSSSSLQVQQSTLSNPTYVRNAAAAQGMVAATDTESITLSKDVVCYDASGNLSLSQSLAVAAQG